MGLMPSGASILFSAPPPAPALQALGNTKVDFATVWGQGHTMAERTGDGAANFIAWVKEASA